MARPVRRAVVVGGGMIGIKATDALMKRHLRVTMVELAPRILSAALDETASQHADRRCCASTACRCSPRTP